MPTLEKPRILVVDDNEDWQKTVRGMLKDEGYDVAIAGTFEDAHALLISQSFNLAVIDMRLDDPDEENIDGITLARIIHKKWPHIQTVIITGFDTPGTVDEAMKPSSEGRLVHDYILKKDANELLLPTIQRLLSESVNS
ncbi:MAG: response regulator [Anaerolineae bacterium]|nr:response regulator [Anaerolineae bacterium]